jgi:Tfp pilus assembly protein PilF
LIPLRALTVTAFRATAAAAGIASLISCRAPASGRSEPQIAGSVTYTKDVAPILFARCAPCHHPGGSAPFSLIEYGDVKGRARLVAAATERRFMPPWLPEPGHGVFAGERRLTSGEIDTIHRWVDQGSIEGNRSDLPGRPTFTDGWQLGEPDLILELPQPYQLMAEGTDVWRNFVIPLPIAEARYVRTVELRPGSARFVHHALMAVDEMRSARRLDAADVEAGFDGMDMGDAYMPDGSLLGWTPGMLPFPGIDGAAWRLEPGADLVLQLHMVPTGKPEIVDPMIGFYFARTPGLGSPMHLLQLDADAGIDIPPGSQDFAVTDAFELPVPVEVLAVYPHAHYVGKSVTGWATLPDGTMRSLLRIDRWDFKWQDVYRYADPVSLPQGATVNLRWRYDNSIANLRRKRSPPTRVVAGNRSSDEMARLQLQVRLRSGGDLLLLQEAQYRHLLRKNPRSARLLYALAGALKDQRRLDEAVRHYRAALALDPGHVKAHINLGGVLMEQGLAGEAITEFRAAVERDPDSSGAHYNLGFAYASRGRLDEAVHHYREAIRCQPAFAEAHNNLGQVLSALGRRDEAIVHLQAAARLMPDSVEIRENLSAASKKAAQRR